MTDLSANLQAHVLTAIADNIPLQIIGSGSKAFYGRPAMGEPLPVAGHSGIVTYEPTELILTARSGTQLKDIESLLAQHGQMLAFEPPYFGEAATLGGAVATGLSGPRRPYAGAVRDVVLGVKIINGQGEILSFGGEVMKNVAGFDVSRLMVGALGSLGVLLEVSLKVLPVPEAEITLQFAMDTRSALSSMNRWASQNLPLTAMCFDGEVLRMRLSGADSVLNSTRQTLGGELMAATEAEAFWFALREQTLDFFQNDLPLWRLSLASASPQPDLQGDWLMDWGGALRWLKTDAPADAIFKAAQNLGGHACRFRSAQGGQFQPLTGGLENLNRKIKHAFDPHGIFNPGRLYAGW